MKASIKPNPCRPASSTSERPLAAQSSSAVRLAPVTMPVGGPADPVCPAAGGGWPLSPPGYRRGRRLRRRCGGRRPTLGCRPTFRRPRLLPFPGRGGTGFRSARGPRRPAVPLPPARRSPGPRRRARWRLPGARLEKRGCVFTTGGRRTGAGRGRFSGARLCRGVPWRGRAVGAEWAAAAGAGLGQEPGRSRSRAAGTRAAGCRVRHPSPPPWRPQAPQGWAPTGSGWRGASAVAPRPREHGRYGGMRRPKSAPSPRRRPGTARARFERRSSDGGAVTAGAPVGPTAAPTTSRTAAPPAPAPA